MIARAPLAKSVVGEGLVFEDSLPLTWAPGALPDGLELARLNAANVQLLGAEASLNEVRVHDALKDESAALVHELQRLEFKMNVLLRLTAQLAVQHHALPPRQRLRLTASGVEWESLDAPAVGATGVVHLYVNAALPEPLMLPCVVAGERPGQAARIAALQFMGVSEVVSELIEKLIFRHHRRLIAVHKLSAI